MKNLVLIVVFLFQMISIAFTQEEYAFYIEIKDTINNVPNIEKVSNSPTIILHTSNKELSELFSKYAIYDFSRAFPTARTKYLRKIYKISCNSLQLMYDLTTKFNSVYPHAEEIEKPILLYTPNDYGKAFPDIGQSNLDLIGAKAAWDITKGDTNVIIGITDTYFEKRHVEFGDQIKYTRGVFDSTGYEAAHGVGTSGIIAAKTDNNVGISSIGFKCRLYCSTNWGSDNEMLYLSQQGVRILSASWLNSCTYLPIAQQVYNEIHDNGTIVVVAAGNGSDNCGSRRAYCYPASYNHVISVTSVAHLYNYGNGLTCWDSNLNTYLPCQWKDCHEQNIGDTLSTYHHNDSVDLCAPGYYVPSTAIHNSYDYDWGTSYAAPHVAGVCGLMLSVNPCLSVDEATRIIKSTAFNIYTIPENNQYRGALGAGRVDAYNAVKEAGTKYIQNVTYSANKTIYSGYLIRAGYNVSSRISPGNVVIPNGKSISFHSRQLISLEGGFEVQLGGSFETVIDPNITYQTLLSNCN